MDIEVTKAFDNCNLLNCIIGNRTIHYAFLGKDNFGRLDKTRLKNQQGKQWVSDEEI